MSTGFSPIPTISAFAFVVAVYDYTGPDDLSPVMAKDHNVGFTAWGWVHRRQTWKRLVRLTDTEAEAREIAYAHYTKTMRELDAADHELDLIEYEVAEDEEE